MKVLVDIGHPAHVHLFKNIIWGLQKKGHEVILTTKDKDIAIQLLKAYNFNFVNLGKTKKNIVSKVFGTLLFDYKLLIIANKFKPDIFISAGSPYASQVCKLLRKHSIAIIDTEHANLTLKLLSLFTDVICTPSCFKKNLGTKHIKFNGYKEVAYLHPHYFSPNPAVLDEIGIARNERFIIIRFVSRNASHDVGYDGIKKNMKCRIVSELQKYGRIIITSEDELPIELQKFRASVSPEKMHDLLYYASLLVGESSTMASECAVLGTPSIFIDFAGRGYTDEQEKKYGLVYNFKNSNVGQENALKKAIELLNNEHLKEDYKEKSNKLIHDKIDVTKFVIDLIEEYFEKSHINTISVLR